MKGFASRPDKGTPTKIAFADHPLHPMLVSFPIAFLLGLLGSDFGYWWTHDPFWARMSLWLAGAGVFMGLVASAAGTAELFLIEGVRRRPAAWSHFVAAVMLMAVASTNWFMRLQDAQSAVLPWGLYLSALTAVLVAFAGWLGGGLVFEHRIGILEAEED